MSDSRASPARATRNPNNVSTMCREYAVTKLERFEAKHTTVNGCRLWTATIRNGYGIFWNGKRLVQAHRWAYEHYIGPIPAGLQIDHLCRVRRCVNPKHLEAVTQRENILRGTGATAANARKTVCKRGHAFAPANTMLVNRKGKTERRCKECNRMYVKRAYYREKASQSEAPTSPDIGTER